MSETNFVVVSGYFVVKEPFCTEQEMHIVEVAGLVLTIATLIACAHFIRLEEKELDEVIPSIWSAYLRKLEAVLRQDIRAFESITPKERRLAERRRLELIVKWLPKLEHNVSLFQALARCLTNKINGKPVEEWAAHEFKAEILLRKAILCRAMLAYAQVHFAVLMWANAFGWPLTWPAISLSLRLCKSLVRRYRTVVILALKISAAYGDHHYENLLASL